MFMVIMIYIHRGLQVSMCLLRVQILQFTSTLAQIDTAKFNMYLFQIFVNSQMIDRYCESYLDHFSMRSHCERIRLNYSKRQCLKFV